MAFMQGDQVVAPGHEYGVGTVIFDHGSILGVQTYNVRWPTETLYMPEDSIRLATAEASRPERP
jgi:hypothetical protein